MNEMTKSVGQFLFACLQKENVTEIFGVPGDYNFTLLDILEQEPGINFVNCRNELNAGCAADGLRLNPDNRWIKKARSIPWEEIEVRYAKLFMNRKGNVAKPLRLALGACIIQGEYGYSDEEIALQI